MWRDHHESLLNDSTHHDEKADVLQRFNNICSHAGMYVTMSEVLDVVKDLPNRKSSGLDGESLKYADPLLCLLLSIICYTCMFKHSYMPQSMINSIIVPLVKNKCGNLTDKNNYQVKLRNRNFVTCTLLSLLWYEIKDVPIYRCKSFKFRTLGVKFRYIYCS